MTISNRDKTHPKHRAAEDSGAFNVQLYSDNGQLLSEYTLDPVKDKITTLRAAEECARSGMVANDLGSTIIIVSQETLTKIRQVQTTVGADTS